MSTKSKKIPPLGKFMRRPRIFSEISDIRVLQSLEFGGLDNDVLLTPTQWGIKLKKLTEHLFLAKLTPENERVFLLHIAATAVAAVEALDYEHPQKDKHK